MADWYADNATEIVENDRRTLDWIRNRAAGIPSLSSLHQSAEESVRRCDGRMGMNVYLTWSVAHEAGNGRLLEIHVGGLVQLRDDVVDNTTYALCVVDDENKRGLRKYHFDYAKPTVRQARRSSIFHLQYGGKPLPQMRGAYHDDHMDVWLEEPRILFFPMSLSLILHLAFREFPDEYTDKLCEDGDWRTVFVHRDQTCLVVPFLRQCLEITTDSEKKRLLWDAVCEPDL